MAGHPTHHFLTRWIEMMQRAGITPPQVCIETGTYRGDGSLVLAEKFSRVHTIELSEKWHLFSRERLAPHPGITCHLGDSGEVVEQIAAELAEPIAFFLDAHFAGGDTAFGQEEVPLLRELQTIARRPYQDLILIDDLRLIGRQGKSGVVGDAIYPLMDYDWSSITTDRMATIIDEGNRTVWAYDEDRVVIFRNLSEDQQTRLKRSAFAHQLRVLPKKIGSFVQRLPGRIGRRLRRVGQGRKAA